MSTVRCFDLPAWLLLITVTQVAADGQRAIDGGVQSGLEPGRVWDLIGGWRQRTACDPRKGVAVDVFFAGPNLRWLYVTDGERIFRRLVKRRGVSSK